MLGVDPYGRPIFKLNGRQVGGGVLEPKDTVPARDVLPTYRWTHLAATYGNGRMCLYVDGKLVASEARVRPHRAAGPRRADRPQRRRPADFRSGLPQQTGRQQQPAARLRHRGAHRRGEDLRPGPVGRRDPRIVRGVPPAARRGDRAGPGTAHPAGHGHRPAGGEVRRILRDAEVPRAVGQPVAAGPVSRHRGALRHGPGQRGVLAGDQFRLRLGHREQQVDVRPELGDRRPARLRRAHGRQARTLRSRPADREHRRPRGGPLALRVDRCRLRLRADRRLGRRVLHDLSGRRGRALRRGHRRRLAGHPVPLRSRARPAWTTST